MADGYLRIERGECGGEGRARVAVDEDKKKISLSIRALLDPSAETEEDGEE